MALFLAAEPALPGFHLIAKQFTDSPFSCIVQLDTLVTAQFFRPPRPTGAVIHTEIRRRRLTRGLTQVRLAGLVGIGRPALVNWENGRFAPLHPAVRGRLEAILGAPMSVLLENENGDTPKDVTVAKVSTLQPHERTKATISQSNTATFTESDIEKQILFAFTRLDDDKQTQESIEAGLVAEFDIPAELAETSQ